MIRAMLVLLVVVAEILPAPAASLNEMEHGPFVSWTIFLQTPPLKPVMQMKVAWNIRAADGTPLRNELYQTINVVP